MVAVALDDHPVPDRATGCIDGNRRSTVVRVGRTRMRVHVDPERCQGHNRCYAIAPELFDVDDEGNAHELNDGVVPAELEEKARLAVANCPEYAISITE
jgi:ferredoxin